MQKRHRDPQRYFNEQALSTQKYIIPFIQSAKEINKSLQVLEIGCGEAGNLKPFLELGCFCTGVDYSLSKIEKAKEYYSTLTFENRIKLISDDIYKTNDFDSKFDIIIVRDVIEHIHDQDKFLGLMKKLMAPNAVAFFAFPPWQNPFGGHQQMCKSKVLSHLPFYHLLPKSIYKLVLQSFGEDKNTISGLLEIKETGISIERFERLVNKNGYIKVLKTLYFINPNYQVKFGLKPLKMNRIIAAIPYFRDFFSTAGYYLIKSN
ncbi:MAG: class I SAM-dependent methyltransferase [Paludibacter sp.]|nr:class I SAM-dependent methyltransferase [Paludibacter sp.]